MADETVLEALELTKRFGKFTAVDGVSFSLRRGEIFGFLGPNGAGKTTTIRMLLGLLKPTAGRALVFGVDMSKAAHKVRARLGYMSQKFSLYRDLTVEQNLRFYARAYGLSGKRLQERVRYAVEIAGLRGREGERTATLAGGWRQRLALAAGILHEPELLFLDEPTAGVDPVSRRAFWNLIYEIASRGTTVFVTTHYMDEAEHCERLAFIYHGRIVALGSPSEIKREHLPGEVVQVTPDDPETAVKLLREAYEAGTLAARGVNLHGAQARVLTDEPERTLVAVEKLLGGAGIGYSDLDVVPPSLEDAFIKLVRDRL